MTRTNISFTLSFLLIFLSPILLDSSPCLVQSIYRSTHPLPCLHNLDRRPTLDNSLDDLVSIHDHSRIYLRVHSILIMVASWLFLVVIDTSFLLDDWVFECHFDFFFYNRHTSSIGFMGTCCPCVLRVS